MGVFSNAKDRVIEQVALSYLNSTVLAPYGRATSLRVDSTTKTIEIEVDLKGETVPVKIQVIDYEIIRKEDRYIAVVKGVRTSREWLTLLATDRLCKREFELPPQAGQLLMRAL
jgi:hypothetical protein